MTKLKRKIKAKKPGPKRQFSKSMLKQVELLAKLGATNDMLAEFFEVSHGTIDNWIRYCPEFKKARKKGGLICDMKVANTLLKRALGYYFKEEQIVHIKGIPKVIKVKKHVIPSEKCLNTWLNNRQRALWSDTQKIQVGGSVQHNHNQVAEIPVNDLSKEAKKLLFEITSKQLATNERPDN